MKILIKNGQVIDPANNVNSMLDILIEKKRISRIGKKFSIRADEIIDASNKIVMPGIVDMHVHLREPGREDKETIFSGTKAALRGGVTSLLAMPNTQPAIDSAGQVELLKKIIAKDAQANVFICSAITKDRAGAILNNLSALKKKGVLAISDDGASVDSDALMLGALKKAKINKLLTICHCEDRFLSANGVMNQGPVSTRLGLRGIPRESEYRRVERDISLAEKSKARIHIAHVSCKESVALIAKAKKKNIKVTAETAPHYFSLSEEAVLDFNTNMKINPPLRTKEDIAAIKQALRLGVIDVIASDHAPHTESEKDVEFERADFGTIGLGTILSASATELVHTGVLTWFDLVKKLCFNPASILGINKGNLSVGKEADIAIIDPCREWIFKKEDIGSISKNSAFLGCLFKSRVEYTICSGEIAYFNR